MINITVVLKPIHSDGTFFSFFFISFFVVSYEKLFFRFPAHLREFFAYSSR